MIGYYVHHHGRGHETRMRCIAEQLDLPVTVLSTLAPRPDESLAWVRLPRDDEDPAPADPTAGGRLHWAPRHDLGLAERSAVIASWIAEASPELMVVDVSVEVATLARLCGVPVAVLAMPGRRDDPPHTLAYDLADLLVAPWPEGVGVPVRWPRAWVDKTVFTGGISRFDGWPRPVPAPATPDAAPLPATAEHGRGLVLWGAGGGSVGHDVLASLRRGTPGWHWEVAGLGRQGRGRQGMGRQLDAVATWCALSAADVVVTHGGQNTVAEVAAARRPAVVVADERPFDEQRSTVERLARAGLAATAVGCPEPEEWPRLLQAALAADPSRWSWWSPGDGAARAARALEEAVIAPLSCVGQDTDPRSGPDAGPDVRREGAPEPPR